MFYNLLYLDNKVTLGKLYFKKKQCYVVNGSEALPTSCVSKKGEKLWEKSTRNVESASQALQGEDKD